MYRTTKNLIGWIVLFALAAPLPVFGQIEIPFVLLEKKGEFTPPPFFDADTFIVDRSPEVSFKVSKVVSGNTLLLDNGEVVRLLGVEIVGEYGAEAYRTLKGLLEGKEVNLEFERRNRNIEGQLLAYVFKDGVSVNNLLREKMVYYNEIDPSLSYTTAFLSKIFPEKDVPMDNWEIIFGETRPPVMKTRIVLKNKQTLRGEYVKETKDYIILRRPFYGKEIIEKKKIAQLSFE